MRSEGRSLWESINAAGLAAGRLEDAHGGVALVRLAHASCLGGRREELRDRSVVLAIGRQLLGALTLLELDGVARRLVLCPPDLPPEQLPAVIQAAEADACVRAADGPPEAALPVATCLTARAELAPAAPASSSRATEWVLLTSGTSGAPRLVLHSLTGLLSAFAAEGRPARSPVVWSTFYDIRRYGGLQIFLRAVHSGSLVLCDPHEPVSEFLARAAAAGVSHISGTPSHWRRVLMSGAAHLLAPRYVRLSGEIADQAILDRLRAAYPRATVAHAFASTEAGVGFEVRDGHAGFPVGLIGASGATQLKVDGETLKVRSPGTAERYLGDEAETLREEDDYVDTGDRVEERAGRYYFMGRRGGVINVGGLKVHPEEVEAVINAHPWVRMSRVQARPNAITGAVVTAEVVLAGNAAGEAAAESRPSEAVLTGELTASCRRALAPHKVPATIHFVPALEVSPSGKLVRPLA